MAALFDLGVSATSKHLANVFDTGELNEEATISRKETVQQEGSRAVKRSVVICGTTLHQAVGLEGLALAVGAACGGGYDLVVLIADGDDDLRQLGVVDGLSGFGGEVVAKVG